jgi:hypothetical protein
MAELLGTSYEASSCFQEPAGPHFCGLADPQNCQRGPATEIGSAARGSSRFTPSEEG